MVYIPGVCSYWALEWHKLTKTPNKQKKKFKKKNKDTIPASDIKDYPCISKQTVRTVPETLKKSKAQILFLVLSKI